MRVNLAKATLNAAMTAPPWALGFAALCMALSVTKGQKFQCHQPKSAHESFTDFTVQDIHNQENIDFSQFRGQVVLVVNVATY